MSLDFTSTPTHFAVQLLKHFYTAGSNIIVSPLSALNPLAILLFNSTDTTRMELIQALVSRENATDAAADQFVEQFAQASNRIEDDWHQLKMAKLLYVHTSYPLSPTFVDALRDKFKTIGKSLDMRSRTIKQQINFDVAANSRDKFANLAIQLPPDSRLLAINAIDVKAFWSSPFDSNKTGRSDFRVVFPDDAFMDMTVPMMAQISSIPYFEDRTDGTKAVELKCRGVEDLSLVAILPKKDITMRAFLEAFTGAKLETILAGLETQHQVQLKMPRFKMSMVHSLAEPLKSLGISKIFEPEANLKADICTDGATANTKDGPLRVTDLLQGCQLEISENGITPSSGKTGDDSEGEDSSSQEDPSKPLFVAERPFLFALLAKQTRQFLYFGAVEDPARD